jgi:hypothetical protein
MLTLSYTRTIILYRLVPFLAKIKILQSDWSMGSTVAVLDSTVAFVDSTAPVVHSFHVNRN